MGIIRHPLTIPSHRHYGQRIDPSSSSGRARRRAAAGGDSSSAAHCFYLLNRKVRPAQPLQIRAPLLPMLLTAPSSPKRKPPQLMPFKKISKLYEIQSNSRRWTLATDHSRTVVV